MRYKIVHLDTFSVIGVRKFASKVDGANFTNIPQMWADFPVDDLNKLRELSNLEPSGVLGVCADMYDDGFDYWIAAATTKECPAGFEKLDIPASQWAVFEIEGAIPKAIQDGFLRIFNEWFPSSGYQHANAPEIEWYSDGNMSSPNYRSAIWIPIVKTKKQKMKTAVIYTSKHGTTAKAAQMIAARLTGSQVSIIDLKKEKRPDIHSFDGIILGAPIYANASSKTMQRFCKENFEVLKQKRLALFVCGMETDEAKQQQELANAYPMVLFNHAITKHFLGGEFQFDKMNFFERAIIKRIAKTDKSISSIKEDEIDKLVTEINK